MMNLNRRIKNQKGMASVEMVPLLFVFVFMFSYALGAFGIVHTGIKNSIGARMYAFETFRNRTNLVYFRDLAGSDASQYSVMGNRTHGVMGEGNADTSDSNLRSTERAIRMGITVDPDGTRNDTDLHVTRIPAATTLSTGQRNTALAVSPVWIMVAYGICINATCGGN